jgi:hypothetical protein
MYNTALSPDLLERTLALELATGLQPDPRQRLLLRQAGWERLPPTVDEYWSRHQSLTPFPAQLAIMRQVFGPGRFLWPEQPRRLVLVWGQGAGKDFLLAHCFNLAALRLACHREPRRLLGIPEGSPIHLVSFSFNAMNAEKVFLAELRAAVEGTLDPSGGNWWEQIAPGGKNGVDDLFYRGEVRFPRGIVVLATHCEKRIAEGLRILFGFLDEFDDYPFTLGSVPDAAGNLWAASSGHARELYDVVAGNVATRFPRYGKLFVASYLKGRHTPLNHLVPALRASSDPGDTIIDQRTTFEANPTRTPDQPPFSTLYRLDPGDAARRFENRLTVELDALYAVPARVRSAYRPELAAAVEVSAETAEELHRGELRRWARLILRHVRPERVERPEVQRIIALDPGKTSSHFCLVAGYRSAAGVSAEPPTIVVDTVLEWVPDQATGTVVDFLNVQEVFRRLLTTWNVRDVTVDQWNSELFVRMAEDHGAHVTLLTMSPAAQLRMAQAARRQVEAGRVLWNDPRITEALLSCRLVRGIPESLPVYDHVKDCFHALVATLARAEETVGSVVPRSLSDVFPYRQSGSREWAPVDPW